MSAGAGPRSVSARVAGVGAGWKAGAPGGQADAELVPSGGAADEAADGLGVEEFVGENDAGAGEGERFADAAGFDGGEGGR